MKWLLNIRFAKRVHSLQADNIQPSEVSRSKSEQYETRQEDETALPINRQNVPTNHVEIEENDEDYYPFAFSPIDTYPFDSDHEFAQPDADTPKHANRTVVRPIQLNDEQIKVWLAMGQKPDDVPAIVTFVVRAPSMGSRSFWNDEINTDDDGSDDDISEYSDYSEESDEEFFEEYSDSTEESNTSNFIISIEDIDDSIDEEIWNWRNDAKN